MKSLPLLPLSPLLAFALIFTTPSFGQGGTVRNSAGYTVPGAVAMLKSDTTMRWTTEGDGRYLIGTVSIDARGARAAAKLRVEGVTMRDGRLIFSLSSPARDVTVEAFGIEGTKRFALKPGPLGGGAQRVEIPHLAPGLYSLRFTVDGDRTISHLMHAGDGVPTQGVRVSNLSAFSAAAASTSATTLTDTVIVRKSGYLTAKVPVTGETSAPLDIVLAADTAAALAAVTDYSVDGPFATVVEANVGPGNNYTIIRPVTLGANGFLHAPIIYGHGINSQVSTFTTFLRSVASHGFVIMARNVLTGGPNNAGNTAAMNDGLNWILRQDTTAGSIYFGKLATDRAASMGYSVGGTAAVDIGAHVALKTVVSIHGHISNAMLHGTLLQTSGTLDNVGLPMQKQTFDSSDVPTFLGTVTGANHGYIQTNNGGVQRPAIIAWLRLRLYNDQGARGYFYGTTCTLCAAPWENPLRKNWN